MKILTNKNIKHISKINFKANSQKQKSQLIY